MTSHRKSVLTKPNCSVKPQFPNQVDYTNFQLAMYMFSECFSSGRCVPLGTEWLNKVKCIAHKCGKAVDDYGTELHKVKRSKGNFIPYNR